MYEELLESCVRFAKDPYGFVLWAFPWGEPNTELADKSGPEPWQEELLRSVGSGLIDISEAIQIARASGHGIGKSALVAWLILWAIATKVDTKGVVTANTEHQLKTKTWAEVSKWHRLSLCNPLFKFTATAIFSIDPAHEKEWRIDMVPWSERNTEAFAGLHNQGKRILLIFDEASAIPDIIWETAEGALTDKNTEIIWCCFGNPTRNTGRFRECFGTGRFSHRWQHKQIDSRTISFTNKELFDKWIKDYGEDSDFVRVRVRGIFPREDAESFIGYETAKEACGREIHEMFGIPWILGVDIGRGSDPSVIYPRRGRDAQSEEPIILHTRDTMKVVREVIKVAHRLRASTIYVDGTGVGGGVVDRLLEQQMPVIEVTFSAKPDETNLQDGTAYANKRAEIWGGLREWLKKGSIYDWTCGENITFVDELTAPNYGYNIRDEIQLESKKDMERRGVPSPNFADALACTFALPALDAYEDDILSQDWRAKLAATNLQEYTDDYNPYSRERIQ